MSTEDTSFKDREELLDWIKNKNPLIFNGYVYRFDEDRYKGTGYDLYFNSNLKSYKKHIEPKPKKKVTLYRYLYTYTSSDEVQYSVWATLSFKDISSSDAVLLKTESKEVEYEE